MSKSKIIKIVVILIPVVLFIAGAYVLIVPPSSNNVNKNASTSIINYLYIGLPMVLTSLILVGFIGLIIWVLRSMKK